MDVYGTDLVTGDADRKCVQIAITVGGLVSATRCLQSALPLGVQAPNKTVTIVAQGCFNVLVTYTRNKLSSSSSTSSLFHGLFHGIHKSYLPAPSAKLETLESPVKLLPAT